MKTERETIVLRRVGGWLLEWDSTRPNSCWVIPEYLQGHRLTEHAVQYPNGSIGWDYHANTPAYVRARVSAFITGCQQKHNTTEREG